MGKNSFLWSLRFVDKGKRACIVKYVKSVMIKKVKYFTQTVDKVHFMDDVYSLFFYNRFMKTNARSDSYDV